MQGMSIIITINSGRDNMTVKYWNTSTTRKSEPPANKKTILKYHDAWARANGYKRQASSFKQQAPAGLNLNTIKK